MSYTAIVCKLTNVRPHPNADRLQLATVYGHQIIVGLDYVEGQIGVFFRTDGQLSEEFAKANDLVQYTDPVTGERRGGFFPKNRRVRAINLRGEKSEGFFAPMNMFEFTGNTSMLQLGDEFDKYNGVPICNKYETRATKQARGRKITHRRETEMLRMHVDTKQFRYEVDKIPVGSLITLTEKLHGTSHRFGRVLDDAPLNYPRLRRLLRLPLTKKVWCYLSGTRRVILERYKGNLYHDDESFRHNVCALLRGNLHKGEVLYMEIVGYTTTGATIMGKQSIEKIKDKALRNDLIGMYGKYMVYHYGCEPGVAKAYVYRIVRHNEDGVATELSWSQVKARCSELGIEHTPELSQEIVHGKNLHNYLKIVVEHSVKGASLLTDKHIREGVVIRVDTPSGGTYWLKSKQWVFGILEGFLKEDENFVDREEAA